MKENSNLTKKYGFGICLTFFILLLTTQGFDCGDPGGQTQVHTNKVGVHITSINPPTISLNQNFRVYFNYNVNSSVTINARITLIIDESTCLVYDQFVSNVSGDGESNVLINSSNFTTNATGCSTVTTLDNKTYDVKIEPTTGNYSTTSETLIIGSNTFNLRYYNPAEALPNGWNQIINLLEDDCETSLAYTTNTNGTVPCETVTFNNGEGLGDYLMRYNGTLHWEPANYNVGFLIGMCTILQTPDNLYGYTFDRFPNPTSGAPMASFVFVQKVNALSGWTNDEKNQLKTYLSGHELGRGRGDINDETHNESFGSNWNTCIMLNADVANSGFYQLHFCAKDARKMKLNWW